MNNLFDIACNFSSDRFDSDLDEVIKRAKDNKVTKFLIVSASLEDTKKVNNIYKDNIEEFWKGKDVRFAYMNNCVGCWWRSPLLLKKMSDKHPNKMEWFANQETDKAQFKKEMSYKDIISWNPQQELFDDDFNECDSGYCGL